MLRDEASRISGNTESGLNKTRALLDVGLRSALFLFCGRAFGVLEKDFYPFNHTKSQFILPFQYTP